MKGHGLLLNTSFKLLIENAFNQNLGLRLKYPQGDVHWNNPLFPVSIYELNLYRIAAAQCSPWTVDVHFRSECEWSLPVKVSYLWTVSFFNVAIFKWWGLLDIVLLTSRLFPRSSRTKWLFLVELKSSQIARKCDRRTNSLELWIQWRFLEESNLLLLFFAFTCLRNEIAEVFSNRYLCRLVSIYPNN